MQIRAKIVDKLDPSSGDVISREEPYFMAFFHFLRAASVSLNTLGFHGAGIGIDIDVSAA